MLALALVMAAAFQPSAQRRDAAAITVGSLLLHNELFSNADGMWYYGTAAMMGVFVVGLLSILSPVSITAMRLQKLCIAAIVLNLLGWCMWYSYLEPGVYNALFDVLHVAALMVLITRSGAGHVGGNRVYRGNAGIWGATNARNILDIKDRG